MKLAKIFRVALLSWKLRRAKKRSYIDRYRNEVGELIEALAKTDSAFAVWPLARLIRKEHEYAPQRSIEVLGELGSPWAIPALADELKRRTFRSHLSIVKALIRIGDPRATDALVLSLSSGEAETATRASEALLAWGWAPTTVRERVLFSLAIGEATGRLNHAEEIDVLVSLIEGRPNDILSVDDTGYRAAEALVNIGAPAVGPLMSAVERWRSKARQHPGDALTSVGACLIRTLALIDNERVAAFLLEFDFVAPSQGYPVGRVRSLANEMGRTLRARASAVEVARRIGTYPAQLWDTSLPDPCRLQIDVFKEIEALLKDRFCPASRGCVIHHGRMVYKWGEINQPSDFGLAKEPIITTLLLLAIQEKLLSSVDEPISKVEPRLAVAPLEKAAKITWRDVALRTSGLHAPWELPDGQTSEVEAATKCSVRLDRDGRLDPCYSFSEVALDLCFETLANKVFHATGDELLQKYIAGPLQFEDRCSFSRLDHKTLRVKHGCLSLSVRDFARIGLLYLRGGQWRNSQVLDPDLVRLFTRSPISQVAPCSGRTTDLGVYSFGWWLNRRGSIDDIPFDAYCATNKSGSSMLWIIPSMELVMAWQDTAFSYFAAEQSLQRRHFGSLFRTFVGDGLRF
jgi:hypothetical protein